MCKFKRVFLVGAMVLTIGSCMFNAVYAGPPVSIDDIGTEDSETTESSSSRSKSAETGSETVAESREFVKKLGEYSDVSMEDETAAKAAQPIKKLVTTAVQVLSYIITFGLVLRAVIDLTFITLPFLRGLLANGYKGSSSGSGMNGGGLGSGGFNSSGFNSGGLGGLGGIGLGGSSQGGSAGQGIQWVSNSALNAVASAGQSRTTDILKLYAKDMIVLLVATPVLLVLAMTGTLTELGFLVGALVSDAIQSFGGML